jgi:hypothetical protein
LLNSRPYRNISLGGWVNWPEWPDTKNLLTNIRRHWRYKDPEQKRGRKKGREHIQQKLQAPSSVSQYLEMPYSTHQLQLDMAKLDLLSPKNLALILHEDVPTPIRSSREDNFQVSKIRRVCFVAFSNQPSQKNSRHTDAQKPGPCISGKERYTNSHTENGRACTLHILYFRSPQVMLFSCLSWVYFCLLLSVMFISILMDLWVPFIQGFFKKICWYLTHRFG